MSSTVRTRIVLLNSLLLIFLSSLSNAATWNSAHTWGGTGSDNGTAVVIDNAGAVYTAGSTTSFGSGGQDVLIVKYSAGGVVEFAKTWGGPGTENAGAVAVDSDGNIYVTGGTSSFGAGWYDVFLIKLTSNGNLIWATTWGGSSYESGYDIAFDGSGNIYVAAEAYSYGATSVLLKFGPNGAVLRTNTYDGPATYDAGYSLTVDSNQNVIVTGISWDYSVHPLHNSILILKYDPQGNLLWSKNWASTFPAQDEAWGFKAVTTDSVGNIYIGGRHSDQCNTFDFSQCDFRVSLLKLSPDGAFRWARTWGMEGAYSTAGSVALDSVGHVRVALIENVFGASGTSPRVGLLSYDADGNLLSQVVWNNGTATTGSGTIGMSLDPDDSAYVVASAANNTGAWAEATGIQGTLSDSLVSNSYSVDAPIGTVSAMTNATVEQIGTADTGGGGSDLFVAQSLSSFGDLGARAAALARSLVGAPYGYGGKGYNFNPGPYVEVAEIVGGYNYERSDCVTKKFLGLGWDTGVDCSGLVMWAYNKAYGATTEFTGSNPVTYPTADGQFRNNFQAEISERDLQLGDLLFFHIDGEQSLANHVAMYVGDDEVAEAPDCGKAVKTSSLRVRVPRDAQTGEPILCDDPPVGSCFLGFRRLSTPVVKMEVRTHSPVTLSVTDPDGHSIDADTIEFAEREVLREIPGVMYYFQDTNDDDTVISPILKTGDYLVKVFPKPGALDTDTYSLSFEAAGTTLTLASSVPISEIPAGGYGIESQGGSVVSFLPVAMNVKPKDSRNRINRKSSGKVLVAVLSNSTFSAGSIDAGSLTFGRTGTEESLASCNKRLRDIDGDGLPDLLCRFHIQLAGFQLGDTLGVLEGSTKLGELIRGKDSVLIVGR